MKGYGQYCPIAKATEVLGERWTPLVLRELLCGSRRFNDLRRGLPLMSPSLLSQRLKTLEHAGVIERQTDERGQASAYRLTAAGEELWPLIERLGVWGQRWVRSQLDTEPNLDAGLLMWDIRRGVDATRLPAERTVIQFDFTDVKPPKRRWWLMGSHGEVELCLRDPGFEVDVFVTSDLGTLTAVWIGDLSIDEALRSGRIELIGERTLCRDFRSWFALSPFAAVERPASARPAA